jgi:ornithine cyclodeaminase/alanine dehydrogenase-like protein (mu-crystallin family)
VAQDILFLSSADLDALGLSTADIVPILEAMFQHKAAGRTVMPPKIFFHRGGSQFYSAMASASAALGFAGCKWQSGDPENPRRGLPYIQGLYILSEDATGQPVAVMDAKWITAHRTAAASALAAKYLAHADARVLAIIGCGLQGRRNLEALKAALPRLARCQAYDIDPRREDAYVADMSGRIGIDVIAARSAEAATANADIVITAGPIEAVRRPTLQPRWLSPGCLTITLDYDSYVTDSTIASMDLILTDDPGQIEDARIHEGKFTAVTRIDAELAELVTVGKGSRTNDQQRILVFNLGIALEDLVTGIELLRRARTRNIGIRLHAD